jgi:hypothetical protein
VRMGVVTGALHWEPCGAPVGSSAAAANGLAAIMNSSLYKLALGESLECLLNSRHPSSVSSVAVVLNWGPPVRMSVKLY